MAVFRDVAPCVIFDFLPDFSRFDVNHLLYAAQVVADDQILFAFPEHGGRHVRFVGILINAFELAVFVSVGYRAQAALVDQAVLQLAVFLFAYTSVKRNVNVYLSACRFCNPF